MTPKKKKPPLPITYPHFRAHATPPRRPTPKPHSSLPEISKAISIPQIRLQNRTPTILQFRAEHMTRIVGLGHNLVLLVREGFLVVETGFIEMGWLVLVLGVMMA